MKKIRSFFDQYQFVLPFPRRDRLSRQLLATLAATGVQDLATADRSHTGAEAVTTGANNFTGLICTFHGTAPFNYQIRVSLYIRLSVVSQAMSCLFCRFFAFKPEIKARTCSAAACSSPKCGLSTAWATTGTPASVSTLLEKQLIS